ncbi:hypothetical protein WMO40_15530 [Bacillaceae bacterium CLA-AA-H227]|uniref:Uncharacterized protein n=1 Tax=Robertmurraya yapensis (ex Hitch et al 2024) TaxID=3133160 RepID=A0ACC6SDM1_9BACI
MKRNNPIATALFIIGIIAIIYGIIAGLNYGTSEDYYLLGDLQGIMGWSIFGSGVVCGVLFFGFSEIIKLLQGIYNQNEQVKPNTEINLDKPTGISIEQERSIITDQVITVINEFYQSKNLKVTNIEETDKADFYKITLENGRTELIELGGFKPIVHSE